MPSRGAGQELAGIGVRELARPGTTRPTRRWADTRAPSGPGLCYRGTRAPGAKPTSGLVPNPSPLPKTSLLASCPTLLGHGGLPGMR